MSSRHRTLSEVWVQLQNRHDIANILREILGQHAVDSTLQEDVSQNVQEATRSVIWIKTIFDLQRTYLSGIATGLSECPPYVLSYLLPSELLFSTILYLINIKSKLFSSQTTLLTKDFTRQRHILAQTTLSGLRLLLIRRETISTQDKWRLQAAINAAWQHDRLLGVEAFVVSQLFAPVLDSVNESRVNAYIQEWSNARLPTYAAGLYPLDIRPETFVTGLIHGTMEEDWADAYWVLFDCLWAVESAVTQRFVDLRRQGSTTGLCTSLSDEVDETLELICQTRTSLLITVFHSTGPMTPPPGLMDSLAINLLDWNDDLERFLSRQDSILQRSAGQPEPTRTTRYGKQVSGLNSYYENAERAFCEWLSNRKAGHEQFNAKTSVSSDDMQDTVRDWIIRMTPTNAETQAKDLEGSLLPVYIVNCPKLHVLPKKLLEYKLRWCDKWAYESVQENSPIVNWKEGIQCPSCPSGDKIKFARLVEPFQSLTTALDRLQVDDYSLSQYSIRDYGSYDAASGTSASEADSGAVSASSQPTLPNNAPPQTSHPNTGISTISLPTENPPGYLDSPVSPAVQTQFFRGQGTYSSLDSPVSPFTESLNVPIPLASRMSVDLPIPVNTPPTSDPAIDIRSDISSLRLNTPSTESSKSMGSISKPKSSRTVRIANSIRRKPTPKEKEPYPLPKDPSFVFSTSGHSLLLWGKGGDYLIRFDIPSNDTTSIQGCKYTITGIEAATAGNHKCVVIINALQKRRLVVYNGINISPESEIELDHGRAGDICLAVSRNDQYVATSINDEITIYKVEEGGIRALAFHHQIQVYELRGGNVHRRTIPVGRSKNPAVAEQFKDPGWFGTSGKGISSKEAAEEAQRSGAIVSRKLYFSPDSQRLVVATQLGDHHVYVDVWDCSREPVSMISENSRSFPLPPWTLNDGDLTGVFYDPVRRCAVLTAFLGKEYPLMIPFPGYDDLQNEVYSTKIIYAAQSPSSQNFVVANAMTEMIQFEYSPTGILVPRKLKKATAKISTNAFKPGCIALAMPLENCLQCFWIKDGSKCMLRNIKLGAGETFKDYDIRPHYDRLMSMKTRAVIARAPTLRIPELDSGDPNLGPSQLSLSRSLSTSISRTDLGESSWRS
ncbi:hypothetical protein GQ43DRAFT_464818 [Delitschia confertaspora ATCC 74209]|uniref:Uncharacterized protein n=1 Tax=Delitschia confertaspora ATCC 74209 TaxID=1513339 RepID=A0A9P4JJJ8_9PLEO|nr:hypothetical protein GQ43DRAFT_464818 [Delitschia confertaspora ATCC 74209]